MVAAGIQEFSVTLAKANVNSELGIEVDHCDDVNILIKGICGGAVLAWNEAHPDLEVRPGDRILEVNGARGELFGCARLVEEIQKGRTLQLKLSREVVMGTGTEVAVCASVVGETPQPERVPEHLTIACRTSPGQCCTGRRSDARPSEAATGVPRGALYGLEMPTGPERLRELGAAWLTRGLCAAGTLPWGNEVERIVSLSEAQSGDVARLTVLWLVVEYRTPSKGLPREFCVTLPPSDAQQSASARPEDLRQVVFSRFFAASLPFSTPKCYFGDVCTSTGGFILICERVPLATQRSSSQHSAAGDIDARSLHMMDLGIPDRDEKYYALFRKAALLAAWAHSGRLGDQLQELFGSAGGFPSGPGFDAMGEADFQELWEASGLRQLVLQAWESLFPADVATPVYVAQLRREALDVALNLPGIKAYLMSAGCPYTSLFCAEVSLEDAFFWRNDDCLMDCGLLNFKSVKMGHVCECFAGLHFMPADTRIAHSAGLVHCFTDSLREFSGPALDAAEVILQVSLYDMARILMSIIDTARSTYRKLEPSMWEQISSRQDRLLCAETRASRELRRGLAAIVDGIVAWRGLRYHEVLARWRADCEALPLGDRLRLRLACAGCSRRARVGRRDPGG